MSLDWGQQFQTNMSDEDIISRLATLNTYANIINALTQVNTNNF